MRRPVRRRRRKLVGNAVKVHFSEWALLLQAPDIGALQQNFKLTKLKLEVCHVRATNTS